MDRFWRYSALAVQSGLAGIICWTALSGYIYVAFEIQRFAATKVEGLSYMEKFSVGGLLGILLIYLDQSAFALFPYYLRIAGFKSKKTRFMYPVVYQIAAAVAWWTGYMPLFDLRACSNLCFLWMDAINERIRKRELDSAPPQASSTGSKGCVKTGSRVNEKFAYKRLAEDKSIRIARIMPSPVLESPIRCQVLEATLDDAPHYIALSYAWDSHEGKVSVICDGSSLTVTPNCARALRSIRELYGKWHAVNVWVDAICIDQGDDADALSERSLQIQIMGEVYKRATHVIAWLGDHKAHSQEICTFLLDVGRAFGREEDEARAWAAAKRVALERTRQWIAFTYNFREFFHRSWFQRLWPVQEGTLPLPGKVTLLCGDSSVPFDFVRAGWQVLTDIGILAGSLNLDQAVALQFYISDALALKRSEQMTTKVRRYGRPLITDLSTFSLTSVMRATRFKSCSVAKDKFFALYGVFKELGIIKSAEDDIDVRRYAHLSDKQTFFVVFLLCFARDGDLSILKSARSYERYLTHDDFWATQLDPYDTLGNMVLGIGLRVRPLLSGHIKDVTPQWRRSLSSFVPDWTQWTPGDMDESDVALVRSYSTRQLWNMGPDPTYGVEKRPRTTLSDPQHKPRLVWTRRVSTRILNEPRQLRLQVQAKVVGIVRSKGTVDSFVMLWDIIASTLNFYEYRRQWRAIDSDVKLNKDPFFKPVPEAVVAALIESVRNFTLNSTAAQILLSLRSIYRESSFSSLLNYARSSLLVWYLWPLFMHRICTTHPSAPACENHHQSASLWSSISYFTYPYLIFTAYLAYDPNEPFRPLRAYTYRLQQRHASFLLISGTYLLWTFRASIYAAMYGDVVIGTHHDWFDTVVQIGLIVQGASFAGGYLADNIAVLLGRIVLSICMVFLAVGVMIKSKLSYVTLATLVTFGMHACACVPGTLREMVGSNAFKRPGTFTSDLTFFTTDTWLTGSSGGAGAVVRCRCCC